MLTMLMGIVDFVTAFLLWSISGYIGPGWLLLFVIAVLAIKGLSSFIPLLPPITLLGVMFGIVDIVAAVLLLLNAGLFQVGYFLWFLIIFLMIKGPMALIGLLMR